LPAWQESLSKIERRAEQTRREAEEQKEKTRQQKELQKRLGADQDVSLEEDEGPQPNPTLEAGKSLPRRFGDFPQELYGKPIEELDDFYDDKYVRIQDLLEFSAFLGADSYDPYVGADLRFLSL